MEGVAAVSLERWIAVVCIVVVVMIVRWRWKMVNQPVLTVEQCEGLSHLVVEDLFENASEVAEPVPISPRYWQDPGLSDSEWIYLCRWMIAHGLTSAPYDWGWIAIIFNSPPRTLALTQKAWELTMNSKFQTSISIGDGNGPINIDGQQTVIFGQGLSGDDIRALVEALRQDASGLPEPDAASVLEAAKSLQDAADGLLPATSPAVTGALAWVRKCVSEAVSNAGGAALWAGTMAVAKALGWV